MPEDECEFKDYCGNLCPIINEGRPYLDCKMRDDILLYLNSPQFKKQYANREELVDDIVSAVIEIFDRTAPRTPSMEEIIKFIRTPSSWRIRTHGLEE